MNVLFTLLIIFASVLSQDIESIKIKQVIEDAYIIGIHMDHDEAKIRGGFHKSFIMKSIDRKTGKVNTTDLEAWVSGNKRWKKRIAGQPRRNVTHDIPHVLITKNAAVVEILVYLDGKQIYTDYMSLYKFKNGWKIVGKVFARF